MKYLKEKMRLFPVLTGFFLMGFVDIVGVAVSYVKKDFGLSDTLANLLPMMVFLWFVVVSVPTGILMGKIGRKNMMLLSGIVTLGAMLFSFVEYRFYIMLCAFSLLGIGNTLLQVSAPSLLTDVVKKEQIASSLTLGYFIKAVSSFLGPVLIGVAVMYLNDWKSVFGIYAVCVAAWIVWLWMTPIQERRETGVSASSFRDVFSFLGNKMLLNLFSIILLSVGFEVGLVTEVPKYLYRSFQLSLEQSAVGCSVYYAARTFGTFVGAIILMRVSSFRLAVTSLATTVVSLVLFLCSGGVWLAVISLALLGFCFSNVFSVTLSMALQHFPLNANEISSLMVMGIAGGALIPPVVGILSDTGGQFVGFLFLLLLLVYMLWRTVCVAGRSKVSSENES